MKKKKASTKKVKIKKLICPQCHERKDLNYRIRWRSPDYAHLQGARDVCRACYINAPINCRIRK